MNYARIGVTKREWNQREKSVKLEDTHGAYINVVYAPKSRTLVDSEYIDGSMEYLDILVPLWVFDKKAIKPWHVSGYRGIEER